jgi:hypothetical protein
MASAVFENGKTQHNCAQLTLFLSNAPAGRVVELFMHTPNWVATGCELALLRFRSGQVTLRNKSPLGRHKYVKRIDCFVYNYTIILYKYIQFFLDKYNSRS